MTPAERISKQATLAAIALALPLQLMVDPAAGWALWIIAAAAFAAAVAGGRRWPRLAPAAVAGAAPIVPVLLASIVHVAALNVFYTVTLAALFGSLLPRVPLDRWELPRPWRLPLGVWALTLALAWPVMIVREAGLRLGTLRDTGALDSWAYLNTPQVESWILFVLLTQLVALVWMEWLCVESAKAGLKTRLYAGPYAAPLAVHGLWIGASLASLVAIYQGTVNIAFLSGGPWPALRRAAGTLLDANAYGTVAALAGPLAFVSIPFLPIRHPRAAQAAALALNWAGAWMSGSRTALVCGAFGTILLVYELLRSGRHEEKAQHGMPSLLAGAAVIVLLFIVGAGAIGPLQRITEARAPGASLRELWTRGGYGSVATRMVRDYPLTGVGAGSFNWMAPDYWRVMANDKLPFDNAQNWWRHQVAELGLIASLPILLWSLLIAWLAITRRAPPDARVETQTLRGLLLGIGAASLLGMPTQNPIVLLTFFYIVARFEMLTRPATAGGPEPGDHGAAGGPDHLRQGHGGPPKLYAEAEGPPLRPVTSNNHWVVEAGLQTRLSRLAWILGILIAVGYAGGQLVLARGPLKPLERAARTNRDYVIGTYPAERLPQGQFRWTKKHATFALAVPSRYLVLTYHVEHPDAGTHPVKLRITTPCQTLVDEFRFDSAADARAFELPQAQTRIVFETDVSRTWKPSDSGKPDTRELGAAIEADFVGTPAVVASQERWIPITPC